MVLHPNLQTKFLFFVVLVKPTLVWNAKLGDPVEEHLFLRHDGFDVGHSRSHVLRRLALRDRAGNCLRRLLLADASRGNGSGDSEDGKGEFHGDEEL